MCRRADIAPIENPAPATATGGLGDSLIALPGLLLRSP